MVVQGSRYSEPQLGFQQMTMKIPNPLFIVKVSQQTDLTLGECGKVNPCHTGCVCSGIVEPRSNVSVRQGQTPTCSEKRKKERKQNEHLSFTYLG